MCRPRPAPRPGWLGRSAASLSLTLSGGATWMRLPRTSGTKPRPRHALAKAAIGAFASPVAPTGTSGSLVCRSRTSSTVHSPPMPRTSPTQGCFSASFVESGPEDVRAEARGCRDGALVVHGADGADSGRASERVPAVGHARRVGAVGERLVDRVADQHPAERHVPGVHAFREDQEVGGHAVVVDAEPGPVRPKPTSTSSAMKTMP